MRHNLAVTGKIMSHPKKMVRHRHLTEVPVSPSVRLFALRQFAVLSRPITQAAFEGSETHPAALRTGSVSFDRQLQDLSELHQNAARRFWLGSERFRRLINNRVKP